MIKETVLFPNTSASLKIILAAEAHIAERIFLVEEQALNTDNSLTHGAGTRRPITKRKC
jgi:hypothetical protein